MSWFVLCIIIAPGIAAVTILTCLRLANMVLQKLEEIERRVWYLEQRPNRSYLVLEERTAVLEQWAKQHHDDDSGEEWKHADD